MHVIDFNQALLMRCHRNENGEIQNGTFGCTKSGTKINLKKLAILALISIFKVIYTVLKKLGSPKTS